MSSSRASERNVSERSRVPGGCASKVLRGFASSVLRGFAPNVRRGFTHNVLGGCSSRLLRGCASRVLGGLPAWCLVLSLQGAVAVAQPAPAERVTFDEAIARATKNNPSAAIAAAGILRAEALLVEARSASRLQVNATALTTTLNRGVEFDGSVVTPRNQVNAGLDVRMPIYAPARWARTAQAADTRRVAEVGAEDARRQTALATADAYLTVIALRRVVETNLVAVETARAHFNLARQLQERGAGSRLNELRAQQELTLDEGLVESARIALYRAQEALGVLIVADGAVDAGDEPLFATPSDLGLDAPTTAPGPQSAANSFLARTDLRLFAAEQQ